MLSWDPKLNWNMHVNKLKLETECNEILNLIKIVANQDWGGDQPTTLKTYGLYLTSNLEYSGIVYFRRDSLSFRAVQPVSNEAFRISTGKLDIYLPLSKLFTW